MKPVLIISDTHYHNFHLYATDDKQGINSRLNDILRATIEAAKALRAAGGDTIIHCGDVFHVRGQVDPTVLNPVMNLYKNLVSTGFKVYMISGNHDLKTNDADYHASTVTALAKCGVTVINEPITYNIDGHDWTFIPWFNDLNTLRKTYKSVPTKQGDQVVYRNLVIHAPLNGVIEGLPDHGLTPADFTGTVFDNVFCGHYHNHKAFPIPGHKGTVMSVGALTHQNWGDVDSKAGYLLWYPNRLGVTEYHETSAPKFMRVAIDDAAIADVAGNYIKLVEIDGWEPEDVELVRSDLIIKGAKGVLVEGIVKKPAVTRTASTKTAPTLQSILGDYIDRNYPGEPDVKITALDILGEVYD